MDIIFWCIREPVTFKKIGKLGNSPVLSLELTDMALDWGKGHGKGRTLVVDWESFLALGPCVGSRRQLEVHWKLPKSWTGDLGLSEGR